MPDKNSLTLQALAKMVAIVVIGGFVLFAVAKTVSQTGGFFDSDSTSDAARLWDDGDKAKAVQHYKKMIDLEDNPMFGRKIDDQKRPLLYARILDVDMQSQETRTALMYAKQVRKRQLTPQVRPLLTVDAAKLLLQNLENGDQMLAQISQIDAGKEVSVEDFRAIPFQPKICPEYTQELRQKLLRRIDRLSNGQKADRLRKYVSSW